MFAFLRRAVIVSLVLAFPVVADDKSALKADEKKPEARPTQVVNKIAVKVVKVDASERTITVESRVPGTRSMKTVKDEVPYADDVKVRVPYPPEQKDANGKTKTLTAAEKAKLKGDPKLPGYPADLSVVTPGALVEIELSVHKVPPGEAKKGVVEKPFATLIYVGLAEEPKPPAPPSAKKK